jgi:arsenite-transporting ATPase
MERALAKYVGPVAKRVYDVPIPGDEYFDAIEYLFERLNGVDQILTDPEITTVRLVTNPEKIVLKETQRAFMYFCLYKVSIDGIIMNRVLPDRVNDTYFEHWRKSQREYMEKAQTFFNPIPIFAVNLFQREVLGYDHLRTLAEEVYGEKNPTERFFKGQPYELSKKAGEYLLRMTLPFVTKGSVDINKVSDELIIRVGGFKRHMLLPKQVAASKTARAKLEGQDLTVYFRGENHGKEKKRA